MELVHYQNLLEFLTTISKDPKVISKHQQSAHHIQKMKLQQIWYTLNMADNPIKPQLANFFHMYGLIRQFLIYKKNRENPRKGDKHYAH